MTSACNVWIMTEVGPFVGFMPVDEVNTMLSGVSFEPNTLAITTDEGEVYPILDILADTVLKSHAAHEDYAVPPEVRRQLIQRVYDESHN